MSENNWTFLTNYAQVLVCLAENPDSRLRDVAKRVGITERSTQRLIAHLDEAGILKRVKQGRRNSYYIKVDARLRHPLEDNCTVGDLLKIVLPLSSVRRLTARNET